MDVPSIEISKGDQVYLKGDKDKLEARRGTS